ncbi:MAG: putative repeat protein (TIGR03847 family) [Myxococcota bacterium]
MTDMTAPFHATGGYLGQPGSRTFFLQAADASSVVTVLAEKSQIDGLGDLLTRVLADIDEVPATDWDRDAMELREPVQPRWRVGTIGVGVDPEASRIILELNEMPNPDDEDHEPEQLRWWLDRDVARRLAAHCNEVVGEGRPTCELCGRPMRASGAHTCPRTNGYGRLTR